MFRRILFLIVILSMLSMACSFSIGTTPEPTAEAAPTTAAVEEEPVDVPTEEEPTEVVEPTEEASGAVRSLDEVKSATIQIVAEGTFIDPQVGLMVNAAGAGSGFIIDPEGIAVTNNHVVTGAALLKVYVAGETRPRNAKVLGVSECSDLAVIDIDGDGFPYLEWTDQPIKVGLDVYAAGFPLGDPEFTLTRGIISKEQANLGTAWTSVDHVIMHDATINPGNSGGPLVTTEGKVIGVNYAGNTSSNQYFAISPAEAQKIIKELRQGKDVTSLGINGQAVASEDGSIYGIWVSSVESGSAADKAGIKPGDIITSLENIVLATDGTMDDYCDILRTKDPSDTLNVSVLRFAEMAYLDGQINGRQLEVSMSFADQFSDDVDAGSEGTGGSSDTYTDWVLWTDSTESIQIEVPAEWVEVDGSVWQTTWGSFNITAPSLTASADLASYWSGYDESGVFFAASSDMGRTGGYMQLMEGVRDWYKKDCRLETADAYEDALYEGRYELWGNCGPNRNYVMVLTARPIVNKTDFLILLELKITKDADLDALDHILNSFVVLGDV